MLVASGFVIVYPLALLWIWRINMLNRINARKTRCFFFLISTLFLCQYAAALNLTTAIVEDENRTSPYPMSAAKYLAQAKKHEGLEKQDFLILAAGRMIFDGEWRQGTAILSQTSDLTDVQTKEKIILLSKIDVMRDRSKASLDKLAKIKDIETLPLHYQIHYHELLAQAYRIEKKQLESIAERIQLDNLLTDEQSKTHNQYALWLTLTNLPQAELISMSEESAQTSELQGWLQLALISRKYRDNSKSLLAALDQWQTKFSMHPANHMLPNPLDSIADKMITQPKQIALLLPLSGALAGPGTAIKEGFMAAYQANNAKESIKIKTYDTEKGEINALYEQAVADGAEYIVGPLTKSQVATVATMNHPVPTLLLNDLNATLEDNSYLFGLSPTYEAHQIAIKARSKGYRHALIIAPNNDWSNEVIKAFTHQWQNEGGQIADTFLYAENEDLNKKMRDLLQITQSQEREKQLKLLLGQNIEAVTSRRQDFDMIFLLAYPSKARQIMPLLKYYYAGDAPVYATSNVYGGNANALKDKDLDGIIFCDIPWVFSHQMGARNWPEQFNSYNRLYALGMDSYALASQLNHLLLFPADGAQETNGTLYLKPSQQVARVLEWGQFKQGLAHSLG